MEKTCRHCAHFVDDPAIIEAEFPGLTVFGSAYSSARGEAGICQKLELFLDPMLVKHCPSSSLRGETDGKS